MARKKAEANPGKVSAAENLDLPLDDGRIDVTLDVSVVTIARFKALGDDWRERMGDILERAAH